MSDVNKLPAFPPVTLTKAQAKRLIKAIEEVRNETTK